MKQILLFCLICIVHTTGLVAQIDSTQFLLKGFQDGYVFYKDGATEVLQMNPPLFVQYKGSMRWEGKQVGYGGRSETSAVESYSTFQAGATVHKLETEKLILTSIFKIFRIERGGKQYRFSSEKQFLKAYPEHKEVLKKYIKDNDINFEVIEDVLQVYNHAVSL